MSAAWPTGTPPLRRPPLWARLTARGGPASARLVTRADAAVMAVPGRYSVTYLLLGPEQVVIADVGSNTDHAGILAALAWLGRSPRQVRAIVPTHLHMDHIIGIDALATRLDAPVALGPVAQAAVRGQHRLRFPPAWRTVRAVPTYLMQGAPRAPLGDLRRGFGFGFPWAKNRFRARLEPLAADLGLPGWQVLETPGHADDALCFYHAGAGFLIAGDTVRNFYGGEWNPLVCDPSAYAATRARLARLSVSAIFPGHGPVLDGPTPLATLRHLPAVVP